MVKQARGLIALSAALCAILTACGGSAGAEEPDDTRVQEMSDGEFLDWANGLRDQRYGYDRPLDLGTINRFSPPSKCAEAVASLEAAEEYGMDWPREWTDIVGNSNLNRAHIAYARHCPELVEPFLEFQKAHGLPN